jgi:putative restriction endonuclease
VHDETKLRLDAILFVRSLRDRWVAVPASELRGFDIHLKGQPGIFKPAELSDPLSLTTTINSKHTQDVIEGSCVQYDYVSRDFENEALKRCADAELPLIYFLQVTRRPSPEYVVFAPVYVVGWDDKARRFLVDLSEQRPSEIAARATRQLGLFRASSREVARTYIAGSVKQRLDAARFRNRVLDSSRGCAVCGLRERALLDAAPIRIALCAIHNRAYNAGILTIDENGVVEVHLDRKGGEAEKSMLLAYDGAKVRIPGS